MFGFQKSDDSFVEIGIDSATDFSIRYEFASKDIFAEKMLYSIGEVKALVSLFYTMDSRSFSALIVDGWKFWA
jgi:hypothetical protein